MIRKRVKRFSLATNAERLRGDHAQTKRSLLLVVVLVIIVFVGIVGLTGMVRSVALVVPELAVDAARGEQLRMRAALDRPAA